MHDARPLAIALMGPTASGKTALALDWAQRLGGEIVSVDSALVYRGLDIGAAKPDADELARVPHHLIDVRDPQAAVFGRRFRRTMPLSAIDAHWPRAAVCPSSSAAPACISAPCWTACRPCPRPIPSVRAAIAAEAARTGLGRRCMPNWPASIPPAAARIHATDPQRIQRALEVLPAQRSRRSATGSAAGRGNAFPFRVLKLVLAPPIAPCCTSASNGASTRCWPPASWTKCAGCAVPIRGLQPLDLPAMRAVGYRQAWEYLDGAVRCRDVPRAQAIAATRQLAKRQLTWLRGELRCALVRSGQRSRRRCDRCTSSAIRCTARLTRRPC